MARNKKPVKIDAGDAAVPQPDLEIFYPDLQNPKCVDNRQNEEKKAEVDCTFAPVSMMLWESMPQLPMFYSYPFAWWAFAADAVASWDAGIKGNINWASEARRQFEKLMFFPDDMVKMRLNFSQTERNFAAADGMDRQNSAVAASAERIRAVTDMGGE